MDPIAAVSAVMLLVDLLGGIAVGMFMGASVASVREDHSLSLTGAVPGPLSDGARGFYGVFIRGSGFVSDTLRGERASEQVLDEEGPGDNGDPNAQGQEPDR
jgi:hypothetical protein